METDKDSGSVREPRRGVRPVDLDSFSRVVRRSQERARELAGQLQANTLPADQAPLLVATDEWLAAVEELEVAEEELRQQNDELALTADAVRREHARYQELFELAPDAYIVTDAAGVIREANQAATSLFRIPRGFLDGKPLAVFVEATDRRIFRDCIDNLLADGRVERCEMQLRPRYGPATYVSAAAVAARDSTSTVRTIRWILRDTTERRRAAERLRAVNAAIERRVGQRTATIERTMLERDARIAVLEKELADERAARLDAESAVARRGDLMGMLSHEIRTPLHASEGYLELLEMSSGDKLGPEQHKYIARMHQCQAYLVKLLEGVLALSRLESNMTDLELTEVSVDAVLATIPAFVDPQALEKKLRIEHRPGDPSVTVRADRGKLQQIVINLVTNAIKHTADGGAVVLTWEATMDKVAIRVSDTGGGIRPADIERIFEPFVQGPLPPGAHYGVGLGLAISRQLARLMGGELTVVSTLGEGSTFTLQLPRHADA